MSSIYITHWPCVQTAQKGVSPSDGYRVQRVFSLFQGAVYLKYPKQPTLLIFLC